MQHVRKRIGKKKEIPTEEKRQRKRYRRGRDRGRDRGEEDTKREMMYVEAEVGEEVEEASL